MTDPTTHHAEAILRAALDELRELSVVLADHLGGGSEWFKQIGDDYFVSAKAIKPELQRRKTDAQITKRALVRANNAVREAMEAKWLPIETLTDKPRGDVVLWGRGYGYRDTPEQIAKEDPRVWLLSYHFDENGKRSFASTETFWGDETYYVDATNWLPLPTPPRGE
jgi:hypothetical protein